MASLDQQISLELSYRIKHLHGHRAGRAGEIGAAERQTVDPYPRFDESLDGCTDINGVTAEPIELGHDQNVLGLQLVHEQGEAEGAMAVLPETVSVMIRLSRSWFTGQIAAWALELLGQIAGPLLSERDRALAEQHRHDRALSAEAIRIASSFQVAFEVTKFEPCFLRELQIALAKRFEPGVESCIGLIQGAFRSLQLAGRAEGLSCLIRRLGTESGDGGKALGTRQHACCND